MRLVKVFLVDDDRAIIDVYKNILDIKSYDVVGEAYDGMEAVEKYRKMQTKPDIILLDHRMPVKNGLNTMKEILEMEPLQCIIFATADYLAAKDAMKMGARNFIIKPFRMDDLFNSIEVTLFKSSQERSMLKERMLGIITRMNTGDPKALVNICDRIEKDVIDEYLPNHDEMDLNTMAELLAKFFDVVGLPYETQIDNSTMKVWNSDCTWMEKHGPNPSFCFVCKCIISRFAGKTGRAYDLKTKSVIMDGAKECVFEVSLTAPAG